MSVASVALRLLVPTACIAVAALGPAVTVAQSPKPTVPRVISVDPARVVCGTDGCWYADNDALYSLAVQTLDAILPDRVGQATLPKVSVAATFPYPALVPPGHLNVQQLQVSHGDVFAVVNSGGIVRVRQASAQKHWSIERVPIATRRGFKTETQDGALGQLLQAGPNNTLFLNNHIENLLRYDRGARRFVRTDIPHMAYTLGADSGGLWRQNDFPAYLNHDPNTYTVQPGMQVLYYRLGPQGNVIGDPQSTDTDGYVPRRINPTFPFPVHGSYDFAGVHAHIFWFSVEREQERKPGEPFRPVRTLIGYDSLRKRWTAPLLVAAYQSPHHPLPVVADGAIYVCESGVQAPVHRYDPASDRWEDATLSLPPHPPAQDAAVNSTLISLEAIPYPALWSVSSRQIVVLERDAFWTTNSPTAPWQRHPLPLANLQHTRCNVAALAATDDALYLGTDRGLWCWHRASKGWDEVVPSVPVPLPQQPDLKTGALRPCLRVLSSAGDNAALYLIVSLPSFAAAFTEENVLLRFDRATHRWSRIAPSALGLADFPPNAFLRTTDGNVLLTGQSNSRQRSPSTCRINAPSIIWSRID